MRKITILLACLILAAQAVFAQKKVTGTVTSAEDGSGIPGVTVLVKGTTIGTTTNINGQYEVVAQPTATLVFSVVGMKSIEVAVGDRSVINIIMEIDVYAIEELIVIGYGEQRKREVTGSITQVKGSEIATLATPSFESQLAGRSPGVQITSVSGVLGVAPRIRIRGIGSISQGTYPLIVVDGVPIFTGDLGGYANNNALGDIHPADIESIEILKDGSATAIYGSRAANGVMLITTKKGSKGRMKVNYNNYLGIAQPVNLFDLLNAKEFEMIANEKFRNKGVAESAKNEGNNEAVDTDWQMAVLRDNAFQQDHNLSISGGTEHTNYYFSLGYTTQEGVSRPNEMNRYALRGNVDQSIKQWLTVGTNIAITQSEYFGMNTGENALSGNIFSAIRQLPNTPVYNPDHPTGYNIDFNSGNLVGRWNNLTSIGDNLPNIRYTLDKNKFETKILRSIANAYATVTILPQLNFKTQIGADATVTEGLLYYNPLHGDGQSVNGRVQKNFQNLTRWNFQNILSFNESFSGIHNVNVTLVNELQKQRINSFFATGTDLSNDFFQYNLISGSYGTPNSGGSLSENGFVSLAGRLNYNYDRKYFLQVSLRRDAISSMPESNRWGTFPGVSVGWTISRESFMESLTFLSDLKLRASYAEVGNTSLSGDYPYSGLYGATKYGNYNGIGFVQMGNDQLQWETSIKYDIGFDASILDGKYKFTFDWFRNDQDNLILFVPTPPSFGIPGNGYNANIGALKNIGYEFSVEANIIKKRDFSWSVGANLTFVKNEITALLEDADQILPNNYVIIKVGESFNAIYGYDYVGVNKANGNPIYRKADGILVQGNIPNSTYYLYDPNNPGDISTASSLSSVTDKKVFGPSLPTYFGAINTTITYKGFDANLMFRFSGGNYIMNRTRDDLLGQAFTNNGSEILGRWQSPENPGDGWTPRLWDQGTNFINTSNQTNGRFVEKGDFFKFQNFIIGYTLPKSITSKIGIDLVRVFFQGQELFMITDYTGIDPEMEVGGVDFNLTPRQRTLTFGLNVTL